MKGAALLGCVLLLAGCERTLRNMYDQPRLDPHEATPLFADGQGTRPPPPGSVAQASGDLAATSSGRRGHAALQRDDQAREASAPPPTTLALLQRGRERFGIYCLPCHGEAGYGDGMVVRRGFPAPPSFHQDRLRQAPDRHFFDVITEGHGVMASYADRVGPEDRWAIVAYLRALQLSQHAPLAQLPPSLRPDAPEAAR